MKTSSRMIGLAICFLVTGWVNPAPGQEEPSDAGVSGRLTPDTTVTRANPFAAMPGRSDSRLGSNGSERTSSRLLQLDGQSTSDLVVKSLTFEHIDALNAESVISPFVSGVGTIAVVKATNSLILCDRQSNIDRMLAELKIVDVPGAGFVVDTIYLKYADAESLGPALESLSSDGGKITVAPRSNSLIISDFQKNVDDIYEKIKTLDKPFGTVEMRTINLKFLDANNLRPVLEKMVSKAGSVGVNPESNSVIICDTEENLKRIIQEIDTADRTPQQILVEVVLMDVRLGTDTEIGVNWDMLTEDIKDVSYRQNLSPDRVKSTTSTSETVGNATAFNSSAILGGDLAVVSDTVRAVIHLIQQKRDVEIIASPRTVVLSGKSGVIQAVEEVPYVEQTDTDKGGSLTSTKFKPVGVTLNVKATLTENNKIYLDLNVMQNVRTGESTQGVPVVDTRSQQTSLLLDDGQTAVMGGLRRSESTKTVNRVPLLSSIPLVGELFKSTSTGVTNSELVVLVSLHIYQGNEVSEKVMDRIETFDKEFDFKKMSPAESAASADPQTDFKKDKQEPLAQ